MTDNKRVMSAAVKVADMFHGYTSYDIATALTCPEADALAELFEACGLDSGDFLDAHAEGDDGGDAHVARKGNR